MAEIFSPTCNIQGISAGYTGPGTKTILPRQAQAKLDLRLVPDQDPDEIFELLRAHLDESGLLRCRRVTWSRGRLLPPAPTPTIPSSRWPSRRVRELSRPRPAGLALVARLRAHVLVSPTGLGPAGRGDRLRQSRLGARTRPTKISALADFLAGIKQIALLIARMGEADLTSAGPAYPGREPQGSRAPG